MQLFALVRHSHFFLSRKKAIIFRFLILWAAPFVSFSAPKIKPAIILASIEGEAHSLSLNEEFKVTLDQSSVGKKIKEKTIVVTGKDGKAQLLFSNGALITIKPGSRFYLRKYDQKIVSSENVPEPSNIEEEPSKSILLAHLDFGELIVKAPKLKKGSTMSLTSPLGTAGVRGTMFQMMAVRNPVTGDISGGINLISGDIEFSGVDGNEVTLVSGQSIQVASSKLGETLASEAGGLIDLTSMYGPALSGDSLPPTIDQIFPSYQEIVGDGLSSVSNVSRTFDSDRGDNWELIHELATDIFFSIEEAETVSSSFSFENISNAVTVDVPEPALSPLSAPAVIASGTDSQSNPDPFGGVFPLISLIGENPLRLEMVEPGISDWKEIDPWVEADDFLGNDISSSVTLFPPAEKITDLLSVPGSHELTYTAQDFRGVNSSVTREIIITVSDSSNPVISFTDIQPFEMPDPDGVYKNWRESISAKDFFGNDISERIEVSIYPEKNSQAESLSLDNIPFNPGEYFITFTVSDPRSDTLVNSNPNHPDLVKLSTSISKTLQVLATPPSIVLKPGKSGPSYIGTEPLLYHPVQRKSVLYPVPDIGPFQLLSQPSTSGEFPHYSASSFTNSDLTQLVQKTFVEDVDYTILNQETTINLSVSDFPVRQAKLPTGDPVSSSLNILVKIVDDLPPLLSVLEGGSSDSPMRVEGVKYNVSGSEILQANEVKFDRDLDPGIIILDNYYSQNEIEQYLGFEVGNGAKESAFGEANMEVAGIYEITYQNISDPSGNLADPITRWVEVYDETAPVLTLYGANPLYVDINSTNVFKDPGAFGLDNLEGLIDWESTLEGSSDSVRRFSVSVEKLVDGDNMVYTSTSSTIEDIITEAKKQDSLDVTFRLTYELADISGNISSIQRQIILLNSPFKLPVLVMHGEDPHWHEVNTEFVDPGVTAYKEMGEGLEPRNLNEYVTTNAYLLDFVGLKSPDYPSPIDPTVVNYYGPPYQGDSSYYLDEQGIRHPQTDADWRKHIIRYVVTDPLGNTSSVDREVRIVDSTPPTIVMNESSQGVNFLNLQGGFGFKDPGAVVTDNYDQQVELQATLLDLTSEQEQEIEFSIVESLGFTNVGSYKISYESKDQNDNQAKAERQIEVIDTIAPQVALITHGALLQGNSLQAVNPVELENSPIIDSEHPVPSSLQYRNGEKPAGVVGGVYDSNITLTLTSDSDFYLYAKPEEILFEGFESITEDDKGSRGHYSAFRVVDSSGQTVLEDPGVYIRNDTNLPLSFSSNAATILSTLIPDQVLQYRISYSVSQSSGEVSNLSNARNLYIIDTEKPTIFAEPDTTSKKVVIEANRDPLSADRYTDLSGSIVKLYDPLGNDSNNSYLIGQTLLLRAVDKVDGILTEGIKRVIKDSTGSELGTIYDNADSQAVAQAIASTIDATVLDVEYQIEYTVSDISIDPSIQPNVSDVVTRRLIVKDTQPPNIQFSELNSTLITDYKSTTNPNVMDETSVANFMLSGLTGSDANNFDQNLQFEATRPNGEPKWNVTFDPAFVPGAIYPEERDVGLGYKVTIYLLDDSGNKSQEIVRYLKVGDYQPPVLTMLGNSEIHDFLRFASSTSANINQSVHLSGQGYPAGTAGSNGKNSPFTDRPEDSSLNPDINATGFAGGEHRLLRADYDFVDPGVYAEDDNAYFDIKDGYPDLDGDGIGEGHLIVRVSERTSMENCSEGSGKIHLYSWFEKNSYTMKDWQEKMGEGNYGYNTQLLPTDANATGSPVKIPDVDGDNLGSGYAFTDANKTNLTNFDMTTMTIEYRAMDGWENKSEIASRRIYIYESRQFDGYAFYATPLTDASGADFEQFYDNGSGDPFLTSARKDQDGDGVSDFWEFALGTDFKDPDSTPDVQDHETFKNLHFEKLSTSDLNTRLQGLNDAAALHNVIGLRDFNATSGL
mgnify:CR=1 FL=1